MSCPPRDVAHPGDDQGQREDRERERRGVEDVDEAAVPLPADQLLGGEAERHQDELEVEPVVREPEEQVDAEDDGNGAEAEPVRVPPRPAEQQVEPVGEDELAGDERDGVVDRRPVPAPVEEHGRLRAGLQVVLRAGGDLQRPAPAAAQRRGEQHEVPRAERERGAAECAEERRVVVDAVDENERRQGECGYQRGPEGAGRREGDCASHDGQSALPSAVAATAAHLRYQS